MADPRVLRNRQQRVADQDRATACRPDPSDSPERTRTARCSPCSDRRGRHTPRTARGCLYSLPESRRLRAVRDVRSDADDDAGHALVAGDGLNHRPFFGRVVHDRPHAAEQRLEDRQTDRGVAFGGRHENRPRPRGARAVVGVIVAVAEEQAVVVVGGVFRDVVDERRAGRALGVEPVELVAERVALPKTRSERLPNTCGSRSCLTRNRRTGMPFTASTPAGSSFRQVT